ncbi:Oidioi.mRNA.OKI2018_I69.chr1.g2055.t1.cds [Oikopleura dioica]|uniref:Oidioi.mRNA.OKI2018_I69.chr1.g2055.t1.cds n=1 Tax=Oikopleura dioica TaxID=34765 RepID=A0ABN7SV03_OIKDI|nr:Oidioi.mRNA.OKI2018_I69.chr1.g2055.t1.cds [Oikopleura dioica]
MQQEVKNSSGSREELRAVRKISPPSSPVTGKITCSKVQSTVNAFAFPKQPNLNRRMSTSDVRTRRMSFDDFKGGIKQRRNSNPGVFAGNIYISRPWSRRTSSTEDEIKNIKNGVILEVKNLCAQNT